MTRSRLVTAALALGVLALLVLPLVLRSGGSGDAAFEGTDAQAVRLAEDSGREAWFEPVLSPASAEVESGLFAIQAAIGALVLGYVFGRLHERRRGREG